MMTSQRNSHSLLTLHEKILDDISVFVGKRFTASRKEAERQSREWVWGERIWKKRESRSWSF